MNRIKFSPEGKIRPAAVVLVGLICRRSPSRSTC
jgi:hypothetical protein